MKIVECVPNFSEGRRKEVVDSLADAITEIKGIKLLDREMDPDHNRSVITFVGGPEEVKKPAFNAIEKAGELIDMEEHRGEHPRIGAADVVPFIPISDMTMEECVVLARELGKEVGEKLGIPVFLYEKAATRKERNDLAFVRKGEYEGLKKEIGTNPDREPDFGPDRMGGAGATAIGVRMPLVAFNVNLATSDIKIAKKIAKSIRFRSGGFRYLKALGFEIKERGITQVSMNFTDYTRTPIFRVFEAIKREAKRYGVMVLGSEVIGLIPLNALVDSAEFYLQIEDFNCDQILEKRLSE